MSPLPALLPSTSGREGNERRIRDRGLRPRLARAGWRRAASLFTDDAVYRSHPFSEPHVGTTAIRNYWNRATRGQEELELQFGTPIVAGDRAAVEWGAQMRSEREDVTMPGILYLRFGSDGRCVDLREIWHLEAARHPPHAGWGL